MDEKYKKAPWRNENGDIIGQHTEFSDIRIASVNQGHPAQTANAHLIAASPCLYAALEKALQFIPHDAEGARDVLHPVLTQSRAALRKARGEA